MIKRLKWNVLYGSDESGGDGGSSSDSDNVYEKATEALAQLAKNDPTLKLPEKEDDDKFVDEEYSDGDGSDIHADEEKEEDEEGDGEQKFIEWQECNLCPGKRFLNEREVESHLKSKDHTRNEKRYEGKDTDDDESIAEVAPKRMTKSERKEYRKRRLLELSSGKASAGAVDEGAIGKDANDTVQSEANKAEVAKLKKEEAAENKKKVATKRKLKKMKERRWKKKQEQKQREEEKSEKENVFQSLPSSSPSSQKKVSSAGERNGSSKKRPKKDAPSTPLKKKKARKGNNNDK